MRESERQGASGGQHPAAIPADAEQVAGRIQRMVANAALNIGTHIPGYGKIAGVRLNDGERFYLFAGKGGVSVIDEHTVLTHWSNTP